MAIRKSTQIAKQKAFIKILERNLGNIKKSCEEAGITRKTFYDWEKDSEDFQKMLELSNKFTMSDKRDLVEDKLMEKVLNNDTSAIIFASRTLNASRGYSEKLDLSAKVEPVTIVFPDFSKDKDK